MLSPAFVGVAIAFGLVSALAVPLGLTSTVAILALMGVTGAVVGRGSGHGAVLGAGLAVGAGVWPAAGVGAAVGAAVGGSVFIETIFGYRGMGRLMVNAVNSRDYQVIESCFLVLALLVLTVDMLAAARKNSVARKLTLREARTDT